MSPTCEGPRHLVRRGQRGLGDRGRTWQCPESQLFRETLAGHWRKEPEMHASFLEGSQGKGAPCPAVVKDTVLLLLLQMSGRLCRRLSRLEEMEPKSAHSPVSWAFTA